MAANENGRKAAPGERQGSPEGGPEKLTEAEIVFCHWQRRQRSPDRCLLTEPRERRLKKLLQTYEVKDLNLVIDWVYDSDHERARFLRNNEYTDLIEIFRIEHFDFRLERAQEWKEDIDDPGIQAPRIPQPPPARSAQPIISAQPVCAMRARKRG